MHIIDKIAERIKFLGALAERNGRLRGVEASAFLHAVFRSAFVRKLSLGNRLVPSAGNPVHGCIPYTFEGRTVYWPEPAGTVSLYHAYWEVYYDSRGHMFDTFGTEVRHGDTVIDCGACEGFFTKKVLEAGAEKVYCVEPSRMMSKCLGLTFGNETGTGRVELVESLLGGEDGEAHFVEDETNPANGRLLGRGEQKESAYPVVQQTLDGFCEKRGTGRVDFIKADVEGAEAELVKGASGTIARHRPRLSIAVYHAPDNFERVRSIVESAAPGYTFRLKGLVISHGEVTPMILHCIPPAG